MHIHKHAHTWLGIFYSTAVVVSVKSFLSPSRFCLFPSAVNESSSQRPPPYRHRHHSPFRRLSPLSYVNKNSPKRCRSSTHLRAIRWFWTQTCGSCASAGTPAPLTSASTRYHIVACARTGRDPLPLYRTSTLFQPYICSAGRSTACGMVRYARTALGPFYTPFLVSYLLQNAERTLERT